MSLASRLFFSGRSRMRAWLASLSARRDSLRRLRVAHPRRVLVVCYGNIYRSAFVEHYLKSLVGPMIEVRSVGFHQVADRPAAERNVKMSRVHGVDLSAHRSSVVAKSDLQWADVMVLMDRVNWVRLVRMGADPEKLVWLGALGPGPVEIEDPYESDDDVLRLLLERLYVCTQNLAVELDSQRGVSGTTPLAPREPAP